MACHLRFNAAPVPEITFLTARLLYSPMQPFAELQFLLFSGITITKTIPSEELTDAVVNFFYPWVLIVPGI